MSNATPAFEESFAALFEESLALQEMRAGEVITAEVVRIDQNFVVVNAGLKSESYVPIEEFRNDRGELVADADEERLEPGDIDRVSPRIGDIHQVRNAFDDRVSISIHLYGGNIGRIERHAFSPDTGIAKPFVSGYSNTLVPNLWAGSAA